ncbi:MAG TPA: methyltransferase domain-containing protein [Rhizomicrobium sp.]|nr:methyltransferase domain-containing protein [Rhizomicrobium sp.]
MTSYMAALVVVASGFVQRQRSRLSSFDRFLIRPSEVATLISGGRTDKTLDTLRLNHGDCAAFDRLYAENDDPWDLADPANRYQQRKYRTLFSLLPKGRRFEAVLDGGCGIGCFTRTLADQSGHVVGIDLSASAIARAKRAHADLSNVEFLAADMFALPPEMDGRFDLIVLADVLYYCPPGEKPETIARRMMKLLRPGGCCAIINHHCLWDQPTRASKRIYAAFQKCPGATVMLRHWAPFFLVTILRNGDDGHP